MLSASQKEKKKHFLIAALQKRTCPSVHPTYTHRVSPSMESSQCNCNISVCHSFFFPLAVLLVAFLLSIALVFLYLVSFLLLSSLLTFHAQLFNFHFNALMSETEGSLIYGVNHSIFCFFPFCPSYYIVLKRERERTKQTENANAKMHNYQVIRFFVATVIKR